MSLILTTTGGIEMTEKQAAASVTPVRQRTQYSCMAASLAMCINALGRETDEDTVNDVMGAQPMKGASWERAFAAAQHFGFRTTLVCPATVPMLKEWTDQGFPVMIAWNPEGRPWSHASVVFDVDADGNVHVADPNIPDPEQTVRVVTKDEFYHKWFEKWPDYLVRRPAMAVMPEVTAQGRQVVAAKKPPGKEHPLCDRLGPTEPVLCPLDKKKGKSKTAYEIYVDNEGYAHDDEGETWYVGPQYAGVHGPHSNIPMTDQRSRSYRPRVSPGVGSRADALAAMAEKARKHGNSWEADFLTSVAKQLRYKGSLSSKQEAVLKRIEQKYSKAASDEEKQKLEQKVARAWLARITDENDTPRQRKLHILDHMTRNRPNDPVLTAIRYRVDQAVPLDSDQAARLRGIMHDENVKDTSGLFVDKGLIPSDGRLGGDNDE